MHRAVKFSVNVSLRIMTRRLSKRINGCQLPLNTWQISAAAVFLGLAGTFQGVYVQVLEPNDLLQRTCMIVHVFTGVAVITLTIIACMIDPADTGMHVENQSEGNYCALCRMVVHKDSKHCRSCDKVTEFKNLIN